MLNIITAILANTILMLSFRENILITLIDLQRIIYNIYTEYLKETNNKLFSESFILYNRCYILASINYKFKSFGSGYITTFSHDAVGIVDIINIDSDTHISKIIKKVWNEFKKEVIQ